MTTWTKGREFQKWAEDVVGTFLILSLFITLVGGAMMFTFWQLPDALTVRALIAGTVVLAVLMGTHSWAQK